MNNIESLYDYVDSEDDEFRNTMATVDKEGKRIWLYPKRPSGYFFNKRLWATIGFLVLFFAGPIVKIDGQPLLMMNFFERKFVILGQLFLPQDFVLFGLGMIIFVMFIIVFTVSFGRIWCGWLCPQTVFLEMIFRPIENWLEGDGRTQKKFDESPLSFNKAWRKTAKQTIYILFSIIIAHVTMAYIVGIENVLSLIKQSPANNPMGFLGLVVFTGLFYFVFARLREQVCITICPYGRLQGVLVNRDTMTIIYDFLRGEPRGRISKNEEQPQKITGDCVDCKLCVQVCPTGIDIRDGIQLECVNCTACIDACDDVMVKVGKPKGLIRYASVETIETGKPFKFKGRTWAYVGVLTALLVLEGLLLWNRSSIETTVMRVPGQLYQETTTGISNLYNAQLVNKTNEQKTVTLKLDSDQGTLKLVGKPNQKIVIEPGKNAEAVFFVEFPRNVKMGRKSDIRIILIEGNTEIETIKTSFMGEGN